GDVPSSEITRFEDLENGDDKPIEKARFIQAVITKDMANQRYIKIGDKFNLQARLGLEAVTYQIEVAGIVELKFDDGMYWHINEDALKYAFIIDYEAMRSEFAGEKGMYVNCHTWNFAYDYQKMSLKTMPTLHEAMREIHGMQTSTRAFTADIPALERLDSYDTRVDRLQLTLLVLEVPLFIMLGFYIFMVSQLIIDYEKNEISVIKSRGANNAQVMWIYLIQSLIIGGIAFIIGPLLAMLLCSLIGASNGFLSFVSRVRMPLKLSGPVFMYAFGSLVLSVGTMLMPAMLHARKSIVEHKQQRARVTRPPFWKRFYLDVILTAISLAGLFTYRAQGKMMTAMTESAAQNVLIPPLLFAVSIGFVLGAGLIAIRLYPLLVQLVFWLRRKDWSATAYATFAQVGRSRGNEQFLMLFLVLTVSIGIFSANAARTVNYNNEAKLKYRIGADIIVETQWYKTTRFVNALPDDLFVDEEGFTRIKPGRNAREERVYIDQPVNMFEGITGIQRTAKVMQPERPGFYRGTNNQSIPMDRFMGIEPYNFAMVAYPPPLIYNAYPWRDYIDMLTMYDYGILVSTKFQETYGVNVGDSIRVGWDDQGERVAPLEFFVLGIIDYWPTISPYPVSDADAPNHGELELYAVANINYLRGSRGAAPYQVWMKRDSHTLIADIYAEMKERKLPITTLQDGRQELITLRQDPMLQGTNGSMTLCFIMTLLVSAVGFIIYWVLSLRARALQFGIFRAIGLKMKDVITMLVGEQLLLSGAAVVLGLIVGNVTASLYVPLLGIVYRNNNQPPDFRVVSSVGDDIKIYVFIALMLAGGCALLWWQLKKIKITQAIKLGED
ncbi:MAG: ABC transporter permease, partial [Clostridia bacterium]|nr:ABC transporter permease [Clostridia bacterium]